MVGACALFTFQLLHQQAVRKGFIGAVNGNVYVLGKLLVRCVNRREPAGTALRLSLRPDLPRFAFVEAIGIDEIKAFIGSAVVFPASRHVVRPGDVLDFDKKRVITGIFLT
ncbi:hypothetical protein D3C87_1569320 [compost metagenome]